MSHLEPEPQHFLSQGEMPSGTPQPPELSSSPQGSSNLGLPETAPVGGPPPSGTPPGGPPGSSYPPGYAPFGVPPGYYPPYGQMYPPGYPPYGYPPGYGPYPMQQAMSRGRGKGESMKIGKVDDRNNKAAAAHAMRMTAPALAIQMDRMRAADDLHPERVKPIRSDFHIFVEEIEAKLRVESEDEVRLSTQVDDLDLFFVNSNLNSRLMRAWEDLTVPVRSSYLMKEEEDRVRFMADDEVASRHCATLTARARSPRPGPKGSKFSKGHTSSKPSSGADVNKGDDKLGDARKRTPQESPDGERPTKSPKDDT